MSAPPARERLSRLLPPGALVAIEELIAELLDERLRDCAEPDRELLTYAEAADRLACSPDAIRKRVARGRLEGRRSGRRRYVTAESVRWLNGAGGGLV